MNGSTADAAAQLYITVQINDTCGGCQRIGGSIYRQRTALHVDGGGAVFRQDSTYIHGIVADEQVFMPHGSSCCGKAVASQRELKGAMCYCGAGSYIQRAAINNLHAMASNQQETTVAAVSCYHINTLFINGVQYQIISHKAAADADIPAYLQHFAEGIVIAYHLTAADGGIHRTGGQCQVCVGQRTVEHTTCCQFNAATRGLYSGFIIHGQMSACDVNQSIGTQGVNGIGSDRHITLQPEGAVINLTTKGGCAVCVQFQRFITILDSGTGICCGARGNGGHLVSLLGKAAQPIGTDVSSGFICGQAIHRECTAHGQRAAVGQYSAQGKILTYQRVVTAQSSGQRTCRGMNGGT